MQDKYTNKLIAKTTKKISKLFNVKSKDVIINAIGKEGDIIDSLEFSIKDKNYVLITQK